MMTNTKMVRKTTSKFSLLSLFTVITLIAFNFTIIGTFVPVANADPVWVPIYKYHDYYCSDCGSFVDCDLLDTGLAKLEHGATVSHDELPGYINYIESWEFVDVDVEDCITCYWYSLWTSS